MHPTAKSNCRSFFETYANSFKLNANVKVIEIGSQDVNGSLRKTVPHGFEYIGVDFIAGKGVDVVLTDPYTFPFDTASADIILASSCFEHSEMFWLAFLEIMRVLKPKGLFYLNAPSNGNFHRYPVDCWRFYPDSGRALVTWANRNSINSALLESYINSQAKDIWNDFVAVFLKDENYASEFPRRIIDRKRDITNGLIYGSNDFINKSRKTEDQKALSIFHKLKIKLKKPS